MSKAILDTAEVIHDYMRNGDRSTSREECITWIARLIQEVSQQAPSAKHPMEIEDLSHTIHFADGMDDEAPSATVDEKTQTIAELIFAVATNADETEENRIAWIKREMLDTLVARVKNSQQPSATVDEIANEIRGMKFAFDEREKKDRIEQIARSVEALHSQQPTVDVDALWDKYSIGDTGNTQDILTKELFTNAIQEALRGSYTREDMMKAYSRGQGDVADASLMDDYTRPLVDATEFIQQYDTERGK